MQTLLPIATEIASLLKARAQTIAVAESAAGGLIAAALLAVPGRPTSSAAQSSTPACRAPCCSASPMRRCEGFVHRRSRTPRCWRERRANASAPIGPSPRPARQGRPAIATGTMPVTVAARSRWQWRCPIHHDRYREHRPPSQHARLRESRARTASSPVVVVAAGHGRSGNRGFLLGDSTDHAASNAISQIEWPSRGRYTPLRCAADAASRDG